MELSLQLVLGMTPAHHNRFLFSDHYLNNLLPGDPRWAAAPEEAQEFAAWLEDLYARERAHRL